MGFRGLNWGIFGCFEGVIGCKMNEIPCFVVESGVLIVENAVLIVEKCRGIGIARGVGRTNVHVSRETYPPITWYYLIIIPC